MMQNTASKGPFPTIRDLTPDGRCSAIDPLESLLATAALLSGRSMAEVTRQASMMLTTSVTDLPSTQLPVPHRSSLNNDGSPCQLCITIDQSAVPKTRLIVDPAFHIQNGDTRYHHAKAALRTVVRDSAHEMGALCDTLLDNMLPADAGAKARLPFGCFWLASALNSPGMAVYATTKWGENYGRWERAGRWLDNICSLQDDAIRTLGVLANHTVLVSAGVEGSSLQNARAKLYWRLQAPYTLSDIDIPQLHRHEIFQFLTDVVGDHKITRNAIVGSIGVHVANGTISDAKLDVCGHCVPWEPAEWARIVEQCTSANSLASLPHTWKRQIETTDVAFLGFGVSAGVEARPRINIYLKERKA